MRKFFSAGIKYVGNCSQIASWARVSYARERDDPFVSRMEGQCERDLFQLGLLCEKRKHDAF